MHAWMMDACMTITYNYKIELAIWLIIHNIIVMLGSCMHTGLHGCLLTITTTIIQPYIDS